MTTFVCRLFAAPFPPLSASTLPTKYEYRPRQLALCKVSPQEVSQIGIIFWSTSSLMNKMNGAAFKRCDTVLTLMPNRHLFGCIKRKKIESSSMIFGYWVGPDVEDGWGFVEAAVNQVPC